MQTPPSRPTVEIIEWLNRAQTIWMSSVRPDGRPHLTPIWFVWHEGRFYVGTDPKSVKARNIRSNPSVVMALEDGEHAMICEGKARPVPAPLSESLLAAFFQKYEWDITKDEQYNAVIEIQPVKWLSW